MRMKPTLLPPALLLWLAASATLFCQTPILERQNLGPAVNGPLIEILPLVSPDGRTLYFDRKYDSANVGGVRDQDDIYISRLDSAGRWSDARNAGVPMNSRGSDILFWISPDGRNALVYSDRLTSPGCGLGIARKNGDLWDPPQAIVIDGVSSLGDTYYAQIAPDGKRLLLAYAPDPKSPDNIDIFSAPSIGRDLIHWGAPKGLGPAVNTSSFEGAPFLGVDNRTLYFASDGHGGVGGVDLFMSRRTGSGWSEWSTPVNLGPTINTPFTEASISITAPGDLLYVSGDVENGISYGRSDIYRMTLPAEFRPLPSVIIGGMLKGGDTAVAGLVIADMGGHEVASTGSGEDGRFVMVLPAGQYVRLTGWSAGYAETPIYLQTPAATGEIVPVTLQLQPAGIRSEQIFGPPGHPRSGSERIVLFESGSDDLNPESEHQIAQAAGDFSSKASQTDARIELHAYTDDVGGSKENRDLARRRAEAVMALLLRRGIQRNRITLKAHGELPSGDSREREEERRRNRRVEIRIIPAGRR
jgi:outer membrane protein OmpA-like peptidoglycan-associated protein